MANRAATSALMNALHAWPGWQVARVPGFRGEYQAWVWFDGAPAFNFVASTMGELARMIDLCRLENPRPPLWVEGALEDRDRRALAMPAAVGTDGAPTAALPRPCEHGAPN